MRHSNQGRFRHQVQFLRRQFLQDGGLPFTDVSGKRKSGLRNGPLSPAGYDAES